MAIQRNVLPAAAAAGLVYCQLLVVFCLFVHHANLGLAYETDSKDGKPEQQIFQLTLRFCLSASRKNAISIHRRPIYNFYLAFVLFFFVLMRDILITVLLEMLKHITRRSHCPHH